MSWNGVFKVIGVCALRQRIKAEYEAIFELADVILTPTAPAVAFKIGSDDNDPVKMYTADMLTVPVNIAGLPAISVPCGRNGDNMKKSTIRILIYKICRKMRGDFKEKSSEIR